MPGLRREGNREAAAGSEGVSASAAGEVRQVRKGGLAVILLAETDALQIVNAILTFLALVIPSALTAWVTIQVARIKSQTAAIEVKTDEQTEKIDKANEDRHQIFEETKAQLNAVPKEVVVVNEEPIPVVEHEAK